MFENLIGQEENPNPIDALLKLLDRDDRESKTILEMPHIKFLMRSRWLFLRKKYPQKSLIEKQEMLMQYYVDLKPSYKGHSWEKIVEGIKEMKPQLMDVQQQGIQQ